MVRRVARRRDRANARDDLTLAVDEIEQPSLLQRYEIVREVTERLTKLDETNRQVVSFADQLKRLQDTLNNPKQRGVLGEYYLETVLKNVLPPVRSAMLAMAVRAGKRSLIETPAASMG